MDYKTFRVTYTVTVDVEIPPGTDDRSQDAADKADDFMYAMYARAANIDWVLSDIDVITREDDV